VCLGSLGVHATLSTRFEEAVEPRLRPAWLPPDERVFVVPLEIDVNGSAALLVDVVAIDSGRPFSPCGGMIAATARHPARSDISFEIQLVSAHGERAQPRRSKPDPPAYCART